MNTKRIPALVIASLLASSAQASVDLIAIGRLDGNYEDLASQTAAPLENSIAGNRLGGIDSGLAYAGEQQFSGLARSRTQCQQL
jgi:hypothetical protein